MFHACIKSFRTLIYVTIRMNLLKGTIKKFIVYYVKKYKQYQCKKNEVLCSRLFILDALKYKYT